MDGDGSGKNKNVTVFLMIMMGSTTPFTHELPAKCNTTPRSGSEMHITESFMPESTYSLF